MTANNKPINAWLPSLAESVTSCPCPPEVSEHIPDTDKAETDGDILIRSYPKNSKDSIFRHEVYSVNGCSQPLNLE